MKFGEDLRISIRSIQTRFVESILLIVGIALGIGATAAGFAMVIRSVQESEELLSSTRYREIRVTIREESEDMDLPAVIQESTERIVLTSADLAAREEAEDVQYAYLMNSAHFRLGVPDFRGFGQGSGGGARSGGQPSGSNQSESAAPPAGEQGKGSQPGDRSDGAAAREDTGRTPTDLSSGEEGSSTAESTVPRVAQDWLQRMQNLTLPDGPEPVVEEMEGYMVSPEFFDAWNMQAAEGSLFTQSDLEKGEPLLILGSELAKNLFEDGESLGRRVIMNMQLYSIVGILAPTGEAYDNMAFAAAFMPDLQGAGAGMIRRMMGWNTNLYFTVEDSRRLDEARSQLTSWFDRTYGPGLVNITIPREEAEQARDRTSRLVTIILFLALSGLLIAGANVSNILLSRAMRKRRSVGILKALGASVAAVFRMFFVEALFVSIGGALLGAGLSVALSMLMKTSLDFAAISGFMLAVGVFLSWLITTALTILPSIQASKIPAAEAIRYE